MLNQQVSFETAVRQKIHIEVPWKQWHEANPNMSALAADKASVVMLLDTIYSRWDTSAVHINFMLREGKLSVFATAKFPKGKLLLPPCVPKRNQVHDANNEHPYAVPVSVSLVDNKDAPSSLANGDKKVERKSDFLLLPDIKAPTAVAADQSSSADGGGSGGTAGATLVYSKDHSESLNPFWAVRRMTADDMQREKDDIAKEMRTNGDYIRIPAFNCNFVTRNHNCVALAEVGDQALASTRWISLQYISNAKELAEGDELILQHHPRYLKEKKRKIISWQDCQKELDRKKQKVAQEEAKMNKSKK